MKLVYLLLCLLMLASGCTSGPVVIASPPLPENCEKIGDVEGKAWGTLGIGPTAYNFIPMGLNSRYERAYAEALSHAPGATQLANVSVKEDWYWFVLVTGRYVTVKGEAFKCN